MKERPLQLDHSPVTITFEGQKPLKVYVVTPTSAGSQPGYPNMDFRNESLIALPEDINLNAIPKIASLLFAQRGIDHSGILFGPFQKERPYVITEQREGITTSFAIIDQQNSALVVDSNTIAIALKEVETSPSPTP
jgi:hypothetical protein